LLIARKIFVTIKRNKHIIKIKERELLGEHDERKINLIIPACGKESTLILVYLEGKSEA
jgi:hypothetical protein